MITEKKIAREYKTTEFKRYKNQEDANVKYWFEHKKDDLIISLVYPGEYNNAEVRVCGINIEPFRIPMSDSKFETISHTEVLNFAVKQLNRGLA